MTLSTTTDLPSVSSPLNGADPADERAVYGTFEPAGANTRVNEDAWLALFDALDARDVPAIAQAFERCDGALILVTGTGTLRNGRVPRRAWRLLENTPGLLAMERARTYGQAPTEERLPPRVVDAPSAVWWAAPDLLVPVLQHQAVAWRATFERDGAAGPPQRPGLPPVMAWMDRTVDGAVAQRVTTSGLLPGLDQSMQTAPLSGNAVGQAVMATVMAQLMDLHGAHARWALDRDQDPHDPLGRTGDLWRPVRPREDRSLDERLDPEQRHGLREERTYRDDLRRANQWLRLRLPATDSLGHLNGPDQPRQDRRFQGIPLARVWTQALATTVARLTEEPAGLDVWRRWARGWVLTCEDLGFHHGTRTVLLAFWERWPEAPFPLRRDDPLDPNTVLGDPRDPVFTEARLTDWLVNGQGTVEQPARGHRNGWLPARGGRRSEGLPTTWVDWTVLHDREPLMRALIVAGHRLTPDLADRLAPDEGSEHVPAEEQRAWPEVRDRRRFLLERAQLAETFAGLEQEHPAVEPRGRSRL